MISLITPATRGDVDYYLIGIKDGKAQVIETIGMDYGCIRFSTDFFTTP